MAGLIDLTGQKFGRLTAESYFRKNGVTYWHCKCTCGRYRDVNSHSLRRFSIHDCGKCVIPLKNIKISKSHLDAVPYIEDFPHEYPFPMYIIWNLQKYGNALVAEKLVKRLGWNGIQYHCAKHKLKVTVNKTENNNFIVERFQKRGKEK